MNVSAVRATDPDMPWSIVLLLVLLLLLMLPLLLLAIMIMTVAMFMMQMQAQYEVKEWCYERVVDPLIEAFICSSPPGDRDRNCTTSYRGSANGRLETEGTSSS